MTSIIIGYFAVIAFGAAMNAKALGCSIIAALGLLAATPDETKATFIFLLWIPAVLIAAFRD